MAANRFLVHIKSAYQWTKYVRPMIISSGVSIGGRVIFSGLYDCYVGTDGFKFVKYDTLEQARASKIPIISVRVHQQKKPNSRLKPIDLHKYPKLARVCKNTKEFILTMGYSEKSDPDDLKKLPVLMQGAEELLFRFAKK